MPLQAHFRMFKVNLVINLINVGRGNFKFTLLTVRPLLVHHNKEASRFVKQNGFPSIVHALRIKHI